MMSRATGAAPRKGDLSVYIMPGFDSYAELLVRLGRHRVGKCCLYLKRLADLDLGALRELIEASVQAMQPRCIDT